MMKLPEIKYVKIGETDYPIKLTQRAMIEYETLTGESIPSFDNTEKRLKLFLCTARAGARAEGKPFDYTYETFLDLIDDYYMDVTTNFMTVFLEMFTHEEGERVTKKKK